MPTPDAGRYRHTLLLHLRLRGDKLDGQVIAETPDESVHFALSSFAELAKDTAAKPACIERPIHRTVDSGGVSWLLRKILL